MDIKKMKYVNLSEGNVNLGFDGKRIVIEIPVKNLVDCVHDSPENGWLKIIDSDAFAEYIVNNLFADENGYGDQPVFFNVFEDLAVSAYENARDFIIDSDE